MYFNVFHTISHRIITLDHSRKFMELPTPVVKVYFAMVDMDANVGPPRFLPGTHELTPKQVGVTRAGRVLGHS